MTKLKVLDLFSGIGGFSLGLERTGGFETVAFCEIEPYPRAVLKKHWPEVPCYDDVRTLTADTLRRDGIAVDVICGGFPCQDVSLAGKRAGLEGARSGLWREYARLIGELRPSFVIVENVPGLLNLGMGTVLGDLSSLGYDATWDCIPASAVGAPHRRDRVWIIAHTASMQWTEKQRGKSNRDHECTAFVADANAERSHRDWAQGARRFEFKNGCSLGNPDFQSLEVGEDISCHYGAQFSPIVGTGWWLSEPDVGRVAHGISSRVDRLRGLGNAVVPPIPELIGNAILKSLNHETDRHQASRLQARQDGQADQEPQALIDLHPYSQV